MATLCNCEMAWFNLCCSSLCWKASKPNIATERSESPVSTAGTPFCVAELRRALEEQSFGIKSFTIIPTPSEEGRATVVLLEGKAIEVQLTMQGYSIADPSNSESGTIYETLEDLLRAVSPLYMGKQQETIVKALSRLT